jgi:acyl carrier protein
MSIEEKLRTLVCEELGVKAHEVTHEASFMDDLGADSLDAYELQMSIEQEFDIEIPDDTLATLKTVGQMLAHVEQAVAARKGAA